MDDDPPESPDSPTSSVVAIQAAGRRMTARRAATAAREERRVQEERVSEASIRVQSLTRQRLASSATRRLHEERRGGAAVRVQAVMRRRAAAREAAALREATSQADAEAARALQQVEVVTVQRIPRGNGNNVDRRRGRLSALLRSALGTTTPTTSPTRPAPLVEAQVFAQAEAVPPLATVDRVMSFRDNSDSNMQLPRAEAVVEDAVVPTPGPAPLAQQRFLNRDQQRRPATTPEGDRRPPLPAAPPPSENFIFRSLREITGGGGATTTTTTTAPAPSSSSSSSSRPMSERRLREVADIAARGATVDMRLGALGILTEEARPSLAALLALVRPLYDADVRVRVEAVRTAQKLGSLELVQFALDDEAVAVRTAVIHALAAPTTFWQPEEDEDDAPETPMYQTPRGDPATRQFTAFGGHTNDNGVRRRENARRLAALIVALMKALEDVSLGDESLIAVLKRLEGALLATGIKDGVLLCAPLEKAMQAQRTEIVRGAVVRTAGALRAVDALKRIAVFDGAASVRREAVEMLGWNGASGLQRDEAIATIRDVVLSTDDDASVRSHALDWLAKLDDSDGLGDQGLLRDRSAELRVRAAELLGDVIARRAYDQRPYTEEINELPLRGPEPPPAAPGRIHRARLQDDRAPLAAIGYDVATQRLAEAHSRDSATSVRGAAAAQLARLGEAKLLAVGLDDSHAAHRLRVVELLGDLEDAAEIAVDALRKALHRDADATVRLAALKCLGRLGDPEKSIDEVGTQDSSVDIRVAVVAWLGRLKRADALMKTPLPNDEAPVVRANAARALRDIFLGAIHHQQQQADGSVSLDQALSRVATSTAAAFRSALLMRLGDADRGVRVEAAAALHALRERQWADVIKGDAGDCGRIGRVSGSKATAVLVFILCNDTAIVEDRVQAADALGQRDDLELLSLEALAACCSETQLPPELRVSALVALKKLLKEDDDLHQTSEEEEDGCLGDDHKEDLPLATTWDGRGASQRRLSRQETRSQRLRRERNPPRAVLPGHFYDQLELALTNALNDTEHAGVRVAAVNVVGAARCQGHSLEKVLELAAPVNEKLAARIAAGKEPSADVRAACAKNLQRFGPHSKDAAGALLDALSDKDVTTRDSAAASYTSFAAASFSTELAKKTVAKYKFFLGRNVVVEPQHQPNPNAPNAASVIRGASVRALGKLTTSQHVSLATVHDALKTDRDPSVRCAAADALGSLQSPKSLKHLHAAFKDKRNARVATHASHALAQIDYSQFLEPGETILKHAPVMKKAKSMLFLGSSLKALVLTDLPRLFYVDADKLEPKTCDVTTLQPASDNKGISFQVPGAGRVLVALDLTKAKDWVTARDQAKQPSPVPRRTSSRAAGSAVDLETSRTSPSKHQSRRSSGSSRRTSETSPTQYPPPAFSSPSNGPSATSRPAAVVSTTAFGRPPPAPPSAAPPPPAYPAGFAVPPPVPATNTGGARGRRWS